LQLPEALLSLVDEIEAYVCGRRNAPGMIFLEAVVDLRTHFLFSHLLLYLEQTFLLSLARHKL
jgi:hypothetical protein